MGEMMGELHFFDNASTKLSLQLSFDETDVDYLTYYIERINRKRHLNEFELIISDGRWRMVEEYADVSPFVDRVGEFISAIDTVDKLEDDFRLKSLQSHDRHSPEISKIWKLWEESRGTLSSAFFEGLTDTGLFGRAIILDYDESKNGLVFKYIGLDHRKKFQTWPITAIGKRHDKNQPDDRYTLWLADQYNSAFSNKNPSRDLIDAVINTPNSTILTRTQYDRAILPCSYVDGTPALFVVSKVTPQLFPLAE